VTGIEIPETGAKATIRKWSDTAKRPAELGVAASAAFAASDVMAASPGADLNWIPIVTGILSLVIRLLPLFFSKK